MYQSTEKGSNALLYIAEFGSLFVSYVLAGCIWLYMYKAMSTALVVSMLQESSVAVFTSYIIIVLLYNNTNNFMNRGRFEEIRCIITQSFMMACVTAVIMVLMHEDNAISRGVYIITFAIYVACTYLVHELLKYSIVRRKKDKTSASQVVVIAARDRAEKTIDTLKAAGGWQTRIKGLVIIDEDLTGQSISGIEVKSSIEEVIEYSRTAVIDEVLINADNEEVNALKNIIMEFENMGITVNIKLDLLNELDGFDTRYQLLGNMPVVTFANKIYDNNKLVVKRVIDILGAIIGIFFTGIITIFLAPVLLIESPGPLIFSQTRVGRNGRFFKIYKFRSMYMDAEERKKELMDKNEMNGLMFKMTDDPRITKVGKFIRKTSLDEFPQFINVLKGDMSLVGTRPPTVDEYKQYATYHKRRLSAKPGITGLWQVSGRNSIENFEDVVKLDIEYIDNWSIWLDIKIILKTVGVIFKKGGK